MKNSLFAVVAVSFLMLAGCAEKNYVDDNGIVSGSEAAVSAELDELHRERRDAFYSSIGLESNNALADETGGIMKLAQRTPEKNITYGESRTKVLVEKLKASRDYHIIYADNDVKMETAVKDRKMKISVCTEQSASMMIFNGNTVHCYSPIEGSGYKITLSDKDMESYSGETLLDSTLYYPLNDSDEVSVSTVNSDGEEYTCELFDGFAYLFDSDGAMKMFCDNSNNFTASIETGNISESIFELPEGYVVMDHDDSGK